MEFAGALDSVTIRAGHCMAGRLRVPRRPAWRPEQSAEEVDAQERAAFLAWRRALALLEEQERLVLTPFEKNLEVWRQLWRVLERSHIVVQVGPPTCRISSSRLQTGLCVIIAVF
jgi:hypothetical protein